MSRGAGRSNPEWEWPRSPPEGRDEVTEWKGQGLSWGRKCPLSTLFTITSLRNLHGLWEEAPQAHKCRTSELAGAPTAQDGLEATASAPPSPGSPQEALGLRPHPTAELESQLHKIPRRFSGLRSTSLDLIEVTSPFTWERLTPRGRRRAQGHTAGSSLGSTTGSAFEYVTYIFTTSVG